MIMEVVPVGSQMARACTGRQERPGGGDRSSWRGSGAAERPEAADEGGGSSWLGQLARAADGAAARVYSGVPGVDGKVMRRSNPPDQLPVPPGIYR